MTLTWSARAGRCCLRIEGSATFQFHPLGALAPAEISRRVAILPSELLEARPDVGALQSLPGTFALEGGGIYFTPRFPFVNGLSYAVVLDGKDVWIIDGATGPAVPSTSVVAIYPRVPLVPVNLLKVYVCFSAPMSEGWALRAVRVHGANNGEPLQDVFLHMPDELWDPERTRLTLLLDPGRIKRGLRPQVEAGYPLVEGQPVVVKVDAMFRDAAGVPLRDGAVQRYDVGAAVRSRVDPRRWRYDAPLVGSFEALVVHFDRPLDSALLEHSLWVRDDAGVPLRGQAAVGVGERDWRFEPDSPWSRGDYAVSIRPRLEDLAGNSLVRLFDRDLSRDEDEAGEVPRVEVAFRCRVS